MTRWALPLCYIRRVLATLCTEQRANQNYSQRRLTGFDEQLNQIDAVRIPLETAMVARQPQGIVQTAILGVIALRWAERFKAEHGVYRSLELGYQTALSDGHASEFALTEGVVRLALQNDLLPGIVVYDRRGESLAA